MTSRCPVCLQDLPQALDEHTLQARLTQLTAPEVAKEARRQADRMTEAAIRTLKTRYEKQVRQAQRAAEKGQLQRSREVERARKEGEKQAKLAVAEDNQARLERLKYDREQERRRFHRENEHLQRQVENLCRKLDKQTSHQLGDQAEVNLFAELRAQFPGDHIEQVPRGASGADIIHNIMDGSKKIGQIIYESKNVSTWQNQFVTKAKRFQTQYKTPYVLIVTRAFPRRTRGLCTMKGIPVVDPRMAPALAGILRNAITEIGKMRLSNTARAGKAQELFQYVLSDEFVTNFCQIRDCVQDLREQQHKERNWHEKAWQTHSTLYDQIESRRRDIEERIKGITRELRTHGNGQQQSDAHACEHHRRNEPEDHCD
jgi:hypothetical protein